MSIESMMPSNHLILCRPLFFLPSIFLSFRVFSKESVVGIRWPKYWSFSFSISPSSEYSGLISSLSKGLSRVFSSTTVQKHQFFGVQPSLWSNSHIHTWLLEKPQLWLDGPLLANVFYSSASFSSIDGNRFLVSHLRTTTSHWRCVTPWLKAGPLRSTPVSWLCQRLEHGGEGILYLLLRYIFK